METLEKAKFVPKEKAVEVVNKVFDKCYADLEPLGRRPINAKDMKRAYNERYLCENWGTKIIEMDESLMHLHGRFADAEYTEITNKYFVKCTCNLRIWSILQDLLEKMAK